MSGEPETLENQPCAFCNEKTLSLMQKEIEVIIRGRVQMVMFRDFTKRKAGSLGLTGTVKNLKDGSVCVVAQGDEDKLNKFIEKKKFS